MNDKVQKAYLDITKAENKMREADADHFRARRAYNKAAIEECFQKLLVIKDLNGTITKSDLDREIEDLVCYMI